MQASPAGRFIPTLLAPIRSLLEGVGFSPNLTKQSHDFVHKSATSIVKPDTHKLYIDI